MAAAIASAAIAATVVRTCFLMASTSGGSVGLVGQPSRPGDLTPRGTFRQECRTCSTFAFFCSPLGGNSAWRPRCRKPAEKKPQDERQGATDGSQSSTDLRHHAARRRAVARHLAQHGGEARDRPPARAPGRRRDRGGLPDHLAGGLRGRAGDLSLIHISEPTRLGMISYAV